MRLMPLGDQAAIAYLEDETAALHFADAVRRANFAWLVDVVQAYTSAAVFFDLASATYSEVTEGLTALNSEAPTGGRAEYQTHRIPCCYELGPDLPRVAEYTRLAVNDLIRLHSEPVYTVYAIGFCPGFPYLGYLPEALSGVPRLETPRLRVEAGSVGLTGRQTGIYTEARPGGWNIIGRTPLELVNVADGYFPLRTGDRVEFFRIDEPEFRQRQGQRLVYVSRSLH